MLKWEDSCLFTTTFGTYTTNSEDLLNRLLYLGCLKLRSQILLLDEKAMYVMYVAFFLFSCRQTASHSGNATQWGELTTKNSEFQWLAVSLKI
jgi:hypothetical protein